MSDQRAAHLLSRQRAAMQPETVAIRARGKTMIEDPGQIFRRDSDSIVTDRYFDPPIPVSHAHR